MPHAILKIARSRLALLYACSVDYEKPIVAGDVLGMFGTAAAWN